MNKRVPPIGKADGTTFEILAERVKDVHNATNSVAKGAVNQLLLSIDDPMERFFYELECIKGSWSVKELHRQIDTKLYFRSDKASRRMSGRFCIKIMENYFPPTGNRANSSWNTLSLPSSSSARSAISLRKALIRSTMRS